jgi:hypothetical protein
MLTKQLIQTSQRSIVATAARRNIREMSSAAVAFSHWSNHYSFAPPEYNDIASINPPSSSTILGNIWTYLLNQLHGYYIPPPTYDISMPTTTATPPAPTTRTSLPTTFHQALSIHDEAPLLITTAHAPYTILHVNQAWQDECGYTRPEALQQSWQDLLPSPHASVRERLVKQVLITRSPHEATLVQYSHKRHNWPMVHHVRMGCLFLEDPVEHTVTNGLAREPVDFLVGILTPVSPSEAQQLL